VLAATLLVSMAIAAAVNSPILRDKAGQNSTDWFEDIAQRVTQTLETSVPSDTIEGDNSTITNELEVPVPHRHTGAHIRQRDKQTQPDAKPLKTGNDTELDYENIALQYVSKTHGIPVEELTVSHKVQPHYWVIDKKMWCMKIDMKKWNLNKGPLPMFDEVCVDLDGNIVNESEFREQDKKAYREKYGKLEPDLYYRLQSMQPNETIKVSIWLRESEAESKRIAREVLSKYPNIEIIENLTEPISKRENPNFEVIGNIPVFIKNGQLSREERLKLRDEIFRAKKEAYAQKEKPLIDHLTAKGYEVTYACIAAPLVYAILPKEEIIALQERDDVADIYLSRTFKPLIDTAAPTIRADKVWSEGHDGALARIAIVEAEGVDFNNPYLPHGYMRPGQTDVGRHATQCAGVAASTHPTFRGVAYNATILSPNADSPLDIDIINASEWAINEYAQVLSCSILKKGSKLFGEDFVKIGGEKEKCIIKIKQG